MNLRSVIKNAIASRLEESQIQEVQGIPEVKNTFDFVKHLSEAIKFKLEEAKVSVGLDPDTVARMKSAGVEQKKPKAPNPVKSKRTSRQEALGNSKQGIYTKADATKPATSIKKPGGNKKYIEKGKKGPSNPPTPISKINQMGVGGKPAAGRPGQTKQDVLDNKVKKIEKGIGNFYGKIQGKK